MSNNKYYISGSLATLALLASGILAIAPSVQFLAPIAALNMALSMIAVCAVFSIMTIALSTVAISKNKAIAEKDDQIEDKNEIINKKAKEIKGKNKIIDEKAKEIEDKDKIINKKIKEIDAKNKYIIRSNIDSKKVHEERKAKRQAEAVEAGDMHLASLFGDDLAQNTSNDQSTKSVEQKQTGGRKVLGMGIGSIAGLLFYAGGLLLLSSNGVYPANDSTGVGNFHDGESINYLPLACARSKYHAR